LGERRIDPVFNDDGKLVGFAKVTRDITERLEAEQTLEKTREALFQSQKMEAIGHLTGGVAHDFNNLLAAALGSLELMQRRLPEGDTRLRVLHQNAVAALKRGSSLTQRMLAFARRQDSKSDAIDVRALVDGLSELIQRCLGPSVILDNGIPASLPRVKADANQLEMALLNLAMNARDAMPDGGAIVLDAHLELGPEELVCLSVNDRGVGMDEETLKKAVEPFYTTKGVGRGTGLGLSMVKGLAERSPGLAQYTGDARRAWTRTGRSDFWGKST
jgi:signal transduction histidine kinase